MPSAPDKKREYNRLRYIEKREEILAAAKRYNDANKEAINAARRQAYANSKEVRDKACADGARWRKENPERVKSKRLEEKYGITLVERNALLVSQGGRCAICRTDSPRGPYGTFHVDHCHTSGKVRGLLCHKCNAGLGAFGDNHERVASAADYLKRAEDA